MNPLIDALWTAVLTVGLMIVVAGLVATLIALLLHGWALFNRAVNRDRVRNILDDTDGRFDPLNRQQINALDQGEPVFLTDHQLTQYVAYADDSTEIRRREHAHGWIVTSTRSTR